VGAVSPDATLREGGKVAERRFSETEMAEIFRRATEEATPGAVHGVGPDGGEKGFTLAQLQAIGSEAGISPEAVLRGALAIDSPAPAPYYRRFAGAPVGVGSAVDLSRPLSDDEFERFASHLRDTFHAHGEVRVNGGHREWRNGNLVFALEPHGEGERLRMSSRKSEGEIMPAIGMAITGLGVFLSLVSVFASPEKAAKLMPIMVATLIQGPATFALGQMRLRAWARRRLDQMQEIGRRIRSVASEPARVLPSGDSES
jgi:hypothetical protein